MSAPAGIAAPDVPTYRQPTRRGKGRAWRYEIGPRVVRIDFGPTGELIRVVEILPGGVENVVVQ